VAGPGDPLPHLRKASVCVHPAFEDGFAYGFELGSPPDWDKDASEKIAHFEAISRQGRKGLWPDWLGESAKP